jgi:hypothetical protein
MLDFCSEKSQITQDMWILSVIIHTSNTIYTRCK